MEETLESPSRCVAFGNWWKSCLWGGGRRGEIKRHRRKTITFLETSVLDWFFSHNTFSPSGGIWEALFSFLIGCSCEGEMRPEESWETERENLPLSFYLWAEPAAPRKHHPFATDHWSQCWCWHKSLHRRFCLNERSPCREHPLEGWCLHNFVFTCKCHRVAKSLFRICNARSRLQGL